MHGSVQSARSNRLDLLRATDAVAPMRCKGPKADSAQGARLSCWGAAKACGPDQPLHGHCSRDEKFATSFPSDVVHEGADPAAAVSGERRVPPTRRPTSALLSNKWNDLTGRMKRQPEETRQGECSNSWSDLQRRAGLTRKLQTMRNLDSIEGRSCWQAHQRKTAAMQALKCTSPRVRLTAICWEGGWWGAAGGGSSAWAAPRMGCVRLCSSFSSALSVAQSSRACSGHSRVLLLQRAGQTAHMF